MPKEDPLKLLQQQARVNQEVLELLYFIAQEMSFRRPAAFLLDQVLGRVAKVMRVEAASLLLLNPETGLLDFAVVKGLNAQAIRELDKHLKPHEGLAGWVFANDKPALINEPDGDKRFQPDVDWLTGFKTRSILAAPLRLDGKPFGVLEAVNRKKKEPFTEEDADLLAAIGRLLATTMDNVRTMEALDDAQVLSRSVLENTEDAFLAVDRRGHLTHVNARAAALFGWKDLPLKKPAADALGHAPELAAALGQVLSQEKPSLRCRFTAAVPGRPAQECHASLFPLCAPGQSPRGVGILIDNQ